MILNYTCENILINKWLDFSKFRSERYYSLIASTFNPLDILLDYQFTIIVHWAAYYAVFWMSLEMKYVWLLADLPWNQMNLVRLLNQSKSYTLKLITLLFSNIADVYRSSPPQSSYTDLEIECTQTHGQMYLSNKSTNLV